MLMKEERRTDGRGVKLGVDVVRVRVVNNTGLQRQE